jgi:RHS repeat-associated protein
MDDNCNGATDEDYTSSVSACGIGGCVRTGEVRCMSGHTVDSCEAGLPQTIDETCNAIDDDCDGSTDEGYVELITHCGVGACSRNGQTLCLNGSAFDTCVAGTPALGDATCNAIDDDCDSRSDEDYVTESVSCGAGACSAVGSTVCIDGHVSSSCIPSQGASSDSVCDGIDEDCNGVVDEDYSHHATSCGVGACQAHGNAQCTLGSVVDSCTPSGPAPFDSSCDGVDNDCNGTIDEDYASAQTACGVGACASVGATVCLMGTVIDSCVPRTPQPADGVCNDVDDDCNGTVDEDYVGNTTSCGVGACIAQGQSICLNGQVVEQCVPGIPAVDDGTCDGIDDDCGGSRDEDYESTPTTCGLGACVSSGLANCVDGSVVNSCQPALSTGPDDDCNGVDEDCDGLADNQYQSLATTCGVGACAASGSVQCVSGTEVDTCHAGTPAPLDATCDAIDEDCDGAIDEEVPEQFTQCGVGVCASVGFTSCFEGTFETSECVPLQPMGNDGDCDTQDDDCDGSTDESFELVPTTCTTDVCAAAGLITCVGGAQIDTCVSEPQCVSERACGNGLDDDADGLTDCADTDCATGASCEQCDNEIDDDDDDAVDCADSDCASSPLCQGEICTNSIDDNDDGLVDCADPECSTTSACSMIPEDPALTAPALPNNRSSSFFDQTQSLFSGDAPVQFGFSAEVASPDHLSVIRGRVTDTNNQPLAGIRVSIRNAPEFGYTFSRLDGLFDLALNGGFEAVVVYEAPGYLTVHRSVLTRWEHYEWAPEVVMTQLDAAATAIDLTGSPSMQIARGTRVVDRDVSRQAVVLFPAGTEAQIAFPDGSTEPLPQATVRATEFTIGDRGLEAMPAPLPATTAYTYAVELSADEAILAGADHVEFSEPVVVYLEEVIAAPVGTAVPSGFYDRRLASWVTSENGRVVRVLSVEGGSAVLDVDDSDEPASAGQLEELGVSAQELEYVAQLYVPGQILWRVPVDHFTPWDFNWPLAPPDTAVPPPPPSNSGGGEGSGGCGGGGSGAGDDDDDDDGDIDEGSDEDPPPTAGCGDSAGPLARDDTRCEGSIIGCFNRSLGQSIPVAGTNVTLEYNSLYAQKVPLNRNIDVQLTPSTPDTNLRFVTVAVEVAGTREFFRFPVEPNKFFHYAWDGKDWAGRPMVGSFDALVTMCNEYEPVRYSTPEAFERAFAQITANDPGTLPIPSSGQYRATLPICRRFVRTLFSNAPTVLLRPSPDLWFDKAGAAVLRPDGSSFPARPAMEVVAGGGSTVLAPGMSAPGTQVEIDWNPGERLDFRVDGSLVRLDQGYLYRIDPNGVASRTADRTVVGPGALSPEGNLFVFDPVVRRVLVYDVLRDTPQWRIGFSQLVAGLGNTPLQPGSFSSYPKTFSLPNTTTDLEAVADATIRMTRCFADSSSAYDCTLQVYRNTRWNRDNLVIDGAPEPTDGQVQTVGSYKLYRNADGSQTIRRNEPFGGISKVFETCSDSSLRIAAITADRTSGTAYAVVDYGDGQPSEIRSLPSSTIPVVCTDSLSVRLQRLRDHWQFVGFVAPGQTIDVLGIGPNGHIYAAVRENGKRFILRSVRPPQTTRPWEAPSGTSLVIDPTSDSILKFDKSGLLLEIQDERTAATTLSLTHDVKGNLTSIRDPFDNITQFTRGSEGELQTIVGPYGHLTTLGYDSRFRPTSITGPLNLTYGLGWGDGDHSAMLTSFTDPSNNTSHYVYENGRIARDEDASGGVQTLSADGNNSGGRTIVRRDGDQNEYQLSIAGEADANQARRSTLPDGTYSENSWDETGAVQTTRQQDGTIVEQRYTSDPRWGFAKPVLASSTVRTTSGRTLTTTNLREIEPGSAIERDTTTTNASSYVREYDPTTRTLMTRTPNGRTFRAAYDLHGRVVQIQQPGQVPVDLEYDPRGRLLSARAEASPGDQRVVNYTYAADGNVATVDWNITGMPETAHYAFDQASRLTSFEQAGDQSVFGYEFDKLTTVTPPAGDLHRLGWTQTGTSSSYQPPGGAPTTATYTSGRRLNRISFPSGDYINHAYVSGRLDSFTTARDVVSFDYDPATGRLSTASRDDVLTGTELTTSTVYDGKLPLSTTWHRDGQAIGSIARTYNDDWRVDSIQINESEPLGFGYDLDGRVIVVGGAGPLVRFSHSDTTVGSRVRLTSNSDLFTGAENNAFGELLRSDAAVFTILNEGSFDIRELFTYVIGNIATGSEAGARDTRGRILMRQERQAQLDPATHTYRHSYDDTGRLKSAERDNTYAAQYTYDANGNRLSKTTSSGVELGVYNERDQLVTYGGRSYDYDEDGYLETVTDDSSGAVTSYDYDAFGNLRTVILPNTTRIDYDADPFNRRIGKRVDGVRRHQFLYKDGIVPIAQLDENGQLEAQFIFAESARIPSFIAKYQSSTCMPGEACDPILYRVLTDHLGSVRQVLNVATQAVAQRLEYDEFGKVLLDTAPGFQPFGFAGGLYDADTGLMRFGARDYDAVTGRWTAKDPIMFRGGQANLYVYVNNDPVNLIDPRGLELPVMEPYDPTGKTPLGPGVPVDMPFGPSRADHANRNQYNRCPSHPPTMCGGNTGDDFQFDNTPFVGGKYRGAGGSECAYDEGGNLMPDPKQTFNFYPDPWTLGHGWNDFGAHYWYGGAGGYNGQQTTSY